MMIEAVMIFLLFAFVGTFVAVDCLRERNAMFDLQVEEALDDQSR